MHEKTLKPAFESSKSDSKKPGQRILMPLLRVGSLLILVMIGIVAMADAYFRRMVNSEAAILLANSGKHDSGEMEAGGLDVGSFKGLPTPVEKYLRRTFPMGELPVHTVRLQQQGDFRAGVDQPWMKFTAVEYMTAPNPGILWNARAQPAPGFWVRVRDYYLHGEILQKETPGDMPDNFASGGGMFVKALSLIPIANERPGPVIDQNNLVRYLCEAPWMPAALLPSKRLHWEPIDESHARAILTDQGRTAEVVFTFNAEGDIVEAMGTRIWQEGGKEEELAWGGTFDDYKSFEGIRIPTTGNAKWMFADGTEYIYGKFTIIDAAFDVHEAW